MRPPVVMRWIHRWVGSKETLRGQLARGVAGIGVLKLIQLPIGLVISVLLARWLGVEGYGVYTYVFSLVSLLALPAYAGLSTLLVREVALYDQSNRRGFLLGVIRRSHQFSVVIALTIVVLVIGFSLRNAEWSVNGRWTLLMVATPIIPFAVILSIRVSVLRGLRQVVRSYIPGMLIQPVLFLIVVGTLGVSGYLNPMTAIVGQVVATLASLVAVSRFLAHSTAGCSSSKPTYDDSRWLSALLPFSGIAIVSYVNTEIFVPLIGMLSTDAEVAYYRVAFSFAVLVAIPLVIVESVSYPHIARLYAEGGKKLLLNLSLRVGFLALFLSLPVVVGLAVFGNDILSLLYGAEYSDAWRPMIVLVLGFFVVNLVGPSMQLLYGTEFEKDALVISMLSVILVLALSVSLIPDHGAFGAALACSIAKISRAVVFWVWARHRLNSVHLEN